MTQDQFTDIYLGYGATDEDRAAFLAASGFTAGDGRREAHELARVGYAALGHDWPFGPDAYLPGDDA